MNKLFKIVGKEIKYLIFLSIPVGLICGIIEILFALNLNEILIAYNLIEGERSFSDYNPIFLIIFVGFLRFIFFFISLLITNLIYELLNQQIRKLVISYNYNYSESLGLIKSQLLLNNVTNKVAEFLNSSSQLCINLAIFLILYFHLAKQSIQLTLISTFFFLLLFAPIILFKKKISLYSENFRNEVNDVLSKIFKDLKNVNFLKIVGSINNERRLILDTNKKTIKPYLKYNFNLSFLNQLPNFLGIIVFVLIIYFNSLNSFIEIAVIVPFLYLMLRSIIVFGHIVYNVGKIIFSKPYIHMLFSNIESVKLIKDNKKDKKNLEIVKKFNLNVQSLEIGYDKSILKNLNLNLNEGDFCLISGKSGVGKSALLSSLMGIMDKLSGEIRWGNIKIEDINLEEFRNKISYCSTEPYLIEGTIKDNILYGIKNNVENKYIEEALIMCSCDFLIENGAYNLDMKIKDDGSGLSSGQKQRISLVRAALNKPKILILDEATVNIDENVEENIIFNMKKLFPDTTILAVSHRNSLKKFADKFLELS
tara:strand:+ start:35334 stop:36944 length:1611 start_codon:yes stop_codon:yes gene_type:complete